ncbi:MAG: M23 family metallopeptidase [Pseudomonadota bacterium]
MWRTGVFAVILAGPVAAEDLNLATPIDCKLGETCFLQQFVDHDPGPGVRDFACGAASYDGHKGTDFRIDTNDMRAGVDVLAPAAGRVRGMRDGMADSLTPAPGSIDGRECGNGLVIEHTDGWSSQLCHLKRGSVTVRQGERVIAGQVVGQVGLSGKTEFPHLHVTMRKNDKVVDPFAPDLAPGSCGTGLGAPLWSDTAIATEAERPTRVIATGFAEGAPDYRAVLDGTYDDILPVRAKPLVLWAVAINGQKGDQMDLVLTTPDGQILTPDGDGLDKNKAQFFRFFGKRAPRGGWAKGTYGWSVTLTRDGVEIDRRAGEVQISR